MGKNRLCIIGVYFGKLPKYFSLWLKSAENNPTIDFFLVTDDNVPNLPENVCCIKMNIKQVKARAEAALGFDVSLDKPYKCCDFKVIYGIMFADYVGQYDYWGHCDFDLIFGDLQYFFDKYDLYSYDRFLALGHLSMYRNTEEVNCRYMCEGGSADYKTVFTNERNFIFDEIPGMTAIYLKNQFPFFVKNIFADIASVHHRYRIIQDYNLDEKIKNYKRQIFYWENGKIYRDYFVNKKLYRDEYIYIHFKKRPNFEIVFDVDSVESFYITNIGFFPKEKQTNIYDVKRLNTYRGALYEKLERKIYLLRNKITRRIKMIRKETGM